MEDDDLTKWFAVAYQAIRSHSDKIIVGHCGLPSTTEGIIMLRGQIKSCIGLGWIAMLGVFI